MRAFASAAGVSAALALLVAGCGGSAKVAPPAATAQVSAKPRCAYRAGWQALANRIGAPVFCPGWLPSPLTSQIGGSSNNVNSTEGRAYLESFIWQDTDTPMISGVLHVNLRGYPGRMTIPTCPTGAFNSDPEPCFSGTRGTVHENGITATIDTVNQGMDEWHVAFVWRFHKSLYTLSEHLAPPVGTYTRLLVYLRHELRSLVLIEPSRST